MARYSMVIDTHTCIGCLACAVACKVEKGSPPGIWLAPVIEQDEGRYPDVRRVYLPLLCMHCEDPPCARACSTGAIARRPDGVVVIDQDRCCGSRACELACPYGAIRFYERPAYYYGLPTFLEERKLALMQPGTAQKCDLCAPRIAGGRQPACVDACPTDSRIFGDLDDPQSRIVRRLMEEPVVALGGGGFARPGVGYTTRGLGTANPIGRGPKTAPGLPRRPQRIWGLSHAAEFSALGTGGGLFLAALLLGFDTPLWGVSLVRLLALALVVLAGLALIGTLGRPGRFLLALRNLRGSWVSRGALADILFIILMGMTAYLGAPQAKEWPVSAVSGAAALLVVTYPALAMGSLRAVPAWLGWRLPVEFLVEGLAAGVAVITILDPVGALGWPLRLLVVFALIRMGLAGLRGWTTSAFDRWGVQVVGTAGTLGAGAGALLLVGPAASVMAILAAGCTLVAAFSGKVTALRSGDRPVPENP